MDWMCLFSVCSALAQTLVQGAAESAAAIDLAAAGSTTAHPGLPADASVLVAGVDAHAAGDAPAQPMSRREELSWLLVLVGAISVLLAHLRSGHVVRQYGDKLLGFMNVGARQALGEAVLREGRSWTADALLQGMEQRRRAVRNVLVGVVLGYALAAALVTVLHLETPAATPLWAVWFAVSFFMFGALSAPVVLLGVSAANFERLFWSWFAPITWGTVAMQMALGAHSANEPLAPVLAAIAVLLTISVAGVALHQRWPQLMPALVRWTRHHRIASVGLTGIALFVTMVLIELSDLPWLWYVLGGAMAGWVFIALCWWTLVDRTRRIVTPLLAAGYAAAIGAAWGALVLMLPEDGEAHWSWVLLSLAGAITAGWLARNAVRSWIGLAYAHKVFSDAQFQVFCWMTTLAGVVVCVGTAARAGLFNDTEAERAVTLLDPVNLWLLAATAAALLAYWLITFHRLQPLWSNKRLLVLRVFSRGRRGERLLDELEYRWRFIGPIVLIGGKDVAERTIDPSKAADFLRGRLQDIFVPTRHELERRVVAMDESPDPDGRYRVNEFYCFDDLWREAVHRLLDSSDAVVLDLSEFSADRLGTTYELQLLREHGALARTVFLFSHQTDRCAVRAALELGPDQPLPAQVIEVEGTVDGAQLVEALVRRIPAKRLGCMAADAAAGTAVGDADEPTEGVGAASQPQLQLPAVPRA
jgi:hypothetical protein